VGKAEKLSEVDALAVIHHERGFVLLNSCHTYQDGHIIFRPGWVWSKGPDGAVQKEVPQPMRVIGRATMAEFMQQDNRLRELMGQSRPVGWTNQHPYIYKVVAAD
jgi:hypothetical protein